MSKENHKVLHISTECFPAAKAGGMADVVGALPMYQGKYGWKASVITPQYVLPWYEQQSFRKQSSGTVVLEGKSYDYTIKKAAKDTLPYPYYCVDIPGLFDRPSIYLNEHGYGYEDEAERNVAFQRAVLQWLVEGKSKFEVLHCHDHQVGFIPFLIQKSPQFEALSAVPTVYTIHNGAYNSRYTWNRRDLLPEFDSTNSQYIDWDGQMDAVATAMRFAHHITAVSPTYLEELQRMLPPLQFMSRHEPGKFSGILNGIDASVWDPKTDPLVDHHLSKSWDQFKKLNKSEILSHLYHLEGIPLISFIGRFAHQKGADLLVPAAERILSRFGFVNFFILGSGDPYIERTVEELRAKFSERVATYIGYNEEMAHKVYAASDFIVMPSRFEPCGLNQMYGMRYGALPIARKTGGLKDTVVDHGDGGAGISFDYDSVEDLSNALSRALYLYRDTKEFRKVRSRAVRQDYSWSTSASSYADIYKQLINV